MRVTVPIMALALCMAGSLALAQGSLEKASSYKTKKQFVAAGAVKLSAAEFTKLIVGRKMTGEGWSWIIKKNGTTDSESYDGSWKEVGAPWTMDGDKYCIIDKGKQKCREVYVLGKFMRMAEDSGKLSPWTVELK